MLGTMKPLFKKLSWVTLIAMAGVYVYLLSTGPRGIPSLLEKRRRIALMEDKNAQLVRANGERRERIRHRDLREPVTDEDAHPLEDRGGRGADLGAAVVVPEDRPVVAPGLCLSERAPLAHADAVSPPSAGEHERRLRRLRRAVYRARGRGGGEDGGEGDEAAHASGSGADDHDCSRAAYCSS